MALVQIDDGVFWLPDDLIVSAVAAIAQQEMRARQYIRLEVECAVFDYPARKADEALLAEVLAAEEER